MGVWLYFQKRLVGEGGVCGAGVYAGALQQNNNFKLTKTQLVSQRVF